MEKSEHLCFAGGRGNAATVENLVERKLSQRIKDRMPVESSNPASEYILRGAEGRHSKQMLMAALATITRT